MESIVSLSVPLSQILAADFCFRGDLKDPALSSSIQNLGLLQPLTVAAHGKKYVLIDGHKRLSVLKQLKIKSADCRILNNTKPQKQLLAALSLNRGQRYADLDIAHILARARKVFLFSDEEIISQILPLLGLAPSIKVLQQYRAVAELPQFARDLISAGVIPFQGAAGLARLKSEDLQDLIKHVLPDIRPSASQLIHLCEWWFDLTQMKKEPLRASLLKNKIQPDLAQTDMRARTEIYYRAVRELRFPALAAKEKAFRAAVKSVMKGDSGIEVRAPDHFEQEGIFLQAHIRDADALARVEKKVGELKKQSAALFDTLL